MSQAARLAREDLRVDVGEVAGEGPFALAAIDIPEKNPRVEPGYFGSADDITVFLLSNAAHCSNFSPNRAQLWDRISAWEHSLG